MIKMEDVDFFEPGTHAFTGTITVWRGTYAELITDSGVKIPLLTEGHPPLPAGARVVLETRKLRPLYQIKSVGQAK